MANRPMWDSLRSSPGPLAVVALVLLLVLFVGWQAYAHLLAPPRAVPLTADAASKNDRLRTLAQQSGGDMSKLSEADRNWVNQVTRGYGAMALRGFATNK